MTAKRRAPRKNARNRKRRLQVPKHMFHRVLRAVKAVAQPGRHVTGSSKPSGRKRPNPWPRCPACFHRVPMLCDHPDCIVCPTCCPGHKKDQESDHDQ